MRGGIIFMFISKGLETIRAGFMCRPTHQPLGVSESLYNSHS